MTKSKSTKQEKISLSEGEMELLNILWETGPSTLGDVHKKYPRKVVLTTIQTRLNGMQLWGGILDVSFKYKDFGNSEVKINSDGILANEAMRLHLVGRGYALSEQVLPAMAEGETKQLTVTLKPTPGH